MRKYKVYADAAADIPREIRVRYDIQTLPIPVSIGDRSFLSGIDLDNDAFYEMLETSETLPVTSQVTPYVFDEVFHKELDEGTEELLVFVINGKGSATYNNAVSTRERFYAENPGADEKMHIHLFDGASYAAGYGYPAMLAAQKLEMGMDAAQVAKLAQEQIKKQRIYFGLYTLRYAGKSGRIPSAAVFVGEALGIKPIMRIWDHVITTAGKARGEKKLIKEIVKMTLEDMEPGTPYTVGYGSDKQACDELCAEMLKKTGYPPVYVFQIGPAIAVNSGPRIVGTVFETRQKKIKKEENKHS